MHPNVQYRIAKSTVIAKMQQITVNGFLPALGITLADLQGAAQENLGITRFSRKLTFLDALRARRAARVNRPAPERVQPPAVRDRTNRISAEFSVAYRLGHTLIPDTIGDLNLADLFDGQVRAAFCPADCMCCSLSALSAQFRCMHDMCIIPVWSTFVCHADNGESQPW